jgi:hypothetical protein
MVFFKAVATTATAFFCDYFFMLLAFALAMNALACASVTPNEAIASATKASVLALLLWLFIRFEASHRMTGSPLRNHS